MFVWWSGGSGAGAVKLAHWSLLTSKYHTRTHHYGTQGDEVEDVRCMWLLSNTTCERTVFARRPARGLVGAAAS